MIFLQFDFLEANSRDETHCRSECQFLLRDGIPENAEALWVSILIFVNTIRTAGGALDRESLVAELRRSHDLGDFPDFRQDWNALIGWGRERVDSIHNSIGGSFRLPRQQVVAKVEHALEQRGLVAVIGESGTGKSAICKAVSVVLRDNAAVLWLESSDFMSPVLDRLRAELRLAHPLSEVLSMLASRNGIVVLDGLERLNDKGAWRQVGLLLQHLHVGESSSPWRVLFSCQSERWGNTPVNLLRAGVPRGTIRVVEVGPIEVEELQEVGRTFPALLRVIEHQHLLPVIRRPKFLDILASNGLLLENSVVECWSGESDLVEWFWRDIVCSGGDGPARSVFLQSLAECLADKNLGFLALMDLSQTQQYLIPALQSDGVCLVRDERVTLSHDLIADWCRQRLLLARQDELEGYLLYRAMNPQWHRAIRLYGLHLLEKEGPDAWLRVYGRMESIAPPLSDSAFLSVGSQKHLDKLWPHLIAENGRLLRLLLIRFLHVATYPHPLAASIVEPEDRDLAHYISARVRVPLWSYWKPMLEVLIVHHNEVVKLVPYEAAQIALAWLQYSNEESPQRDEAARLALAVGERLFLERLPHAFHEDERHRLMYRAALAAANELPEQVSDFSLRVSSRRLTEEIRHGRTWEYVPAVVEFQDQLDQLRAESFPVFEPWPDGPYFSVDEDFRHTSLFDGALLPLMQKRPRVAKEVILALLIREPNARSRSRHTLRDLCCDSYLESNAGFVNASCYDGPFLIFLKTDFEEALDCIIRLVDSATANCLDDLNCTSIPVYFISSPIGPRCFWGGMQVLSWYRGHCVEGALEAALKALEKWLYDALNESSEKAQKAIDQILTHGHSAAFLGLLWEMGRFRPELLAGDLKILLKCARLYFWEYSALASEFVGIGQIISPFQPKERLKLIHEWETMPHRRIQVKFIALRLLHQSKIEAEFFDACRQHWGREREHASSEGIPVGWYDSLISLFDPKNWKDVELPDASIEKQYIPPEEMKEHLAQLQSQNQEFEPHHAVVFFSDVLNGKEMIPEEGIPYLIDYLKKTVVLEPGTDGQQQLRAAVVCGGIAALLKDHVAQVLLDPSRQLWCRKTILDTIAQLPHVGDILEDKSVFEQSAKEFAAEALLVLWPISPADCELRRCIASLVASGYYSVLQKVTRAAFFRRTELGDSWEQLVHLIVRWAELSYHLSVSGSSVTPKPDFEAWRQEYVEPFVDCSLSTDFAGWGYDAIKNGRRTPSEGKRRRRRPSEKLGLYRVEPAIHIHTLSTAFCGIMMPEQANDADEMSKWTTFWLQALECDLADMRTFDEKGKLARIPHAEECRLRQDDLSATFVQLMLQCPCDEAQLFWKPILDLGPPARVWLEYFLGDFLEFGLSCVPTDTFLNTWRAMIAYASESKMWANTEFTWWAHHELWQHLLGFSLQKHRLWKREHAGIVVAMRDIFRELVPQKLDSNRWASSFIYWLRTPAAAPLRVEAIAWILQNAETAGDYWWMGHDNLEDDLSEVLAICWEENRSEVLADSRTLLGFRRLLAILVNRHNCQAMDLQSRMASPT
ncbi:MAG: hypothetical protein WC655_02285 [Candidatus Hydrogenedentales bacterium]